MKILHIVNGLNPGGIEKWLHDLVLNGSVNDIHILKQDPNKGFFEESLKLNGANISYISKDSVFYYLHVFRYIWQRKFDVVHSHVHYSSGIYMLISYFSGVRCRVTHSHIYTSENNLSCFRKIYKNIMKAFIETFSNVRIAVSEVAGGCIFKGSDYVVLPCGIELKKNVKKKKNNTGFPIRIGHVGRFSEEKNHKLMFQVAKKLHDMNVSFKMIFVGEGALKDSFVLESYNLGLQDEIEFRNPSTSVAEFLSNDVDVFLFPSKFEGLGLSLIEAQYYGLPCIVSSTVPREAIFGNCTIINIEQDALDSCIAEIIRKKDYIVQSENFDSVRTAIEVSDINIKNNLKKLNILYSREI